MNRTTTIVLLLAVLLLGFAVWRQAVREASGGDALVVPLLPGVDPARITAIRLESVEHSMTVKLEKDDSGGWRLTDPLAYPANEALMRELLATIGGRARPVPEGELAPGDFTRRGIVDVWERFEQREPRVSRLEVGDVDLDEARVLVRRDGRLYRTPRNLETLLERQVDEFRSARMFDLEASEVVELRRSGAVPGARDQPVPLQLDARREGQGWWMEAPERARLDPETLAHWIAALTREPVQRFVHDAPAELAPFGLDAPNVTVTLADRHGREQTVILGRAQLDGGLHAKRADLPYVWGLDEGAIALLREPALGFLDHELVRVFRERVRELQLLAPERYLVLRFHPPSDVRAAGRWTVAWRPPGGGELGPERPAARERVEDLLGRIERAQILYRPELALSEHFPDDQPRRGLWLVDAGASRQGGRIGEAHTTADGTETAFFHRDRETMVALLPLEIARIAETPAEALLSLELVEVEEVRALGLELSHGGRAREFRRTTAGAWEYVDAPFEATELRPVLDALFFMRASEHLGEAEGELAEPVGVEILHRVGLAESERTRVTVGLGPDGRVLADRGGLRSVLEQSGLHAQLVEIVAKKPR